MLKNRLGRGVDRNRVNNVISVQLIASVRGILG